MGQPRSGNHSKEDRCPAELDAGVLGSLASAWTKPGLSRTKQEIFITSQFILKGCHI